MNNEIKITSWGLGLTYAGSFFGAGFVSGNEIFEFFGSFGYLGYLGLILSIALLAIFGILLVRTVQISGKNSLDTAIILPEWRVARSILGGITVFMMFGILVVMSAGAGALVKQVFDIPHFAGCLLFTIAVCIASMYGISGIVKVFSTLVPILVVTTVVISIISLNKYGLNTDIEITNTNPLLKKWWFSAITYVSYNMITLIGTIIPVGSHIRKRSTIYYGILAGCFLALIIALGILMAVTSVYGSSDAELPMLDIAFKIGNIFGFIYAILLLLAMYGTSLSSFVATITYLENKISSIYKYKLYLIAIMGSVSFVFSLVGFGNLINTVYPVFGYIGFVVLSLILGNFLYCKFKKL